MPLLGEKILNVLAWKKETASTVLINSPQYKVARETFELFAEFQLVEQKKLSGESY